MPNLTALLNYLTTRIIRISILFSTTIPIPITSYILWNQLPIGIRLIILSKLPWTVCNNILHYLKIMCVENDVDPPHNDYLVIPYWDTTPSLGSIIPSGNAISSWLRSFHKQQKHRCRNCGSNGKHTPLPNVPQPPGRRQTQL